MDAARRKQLLRDRKPPQIWPGEPMLGGWYTEAEIEATVSTIRASMDWKVGFGFICEEIVELERQFAAYCGAADCVTNNGAGTGLDMAIMCLELEPGDEVIAPSVNFRAAPMSIVGQGGRWVPAEVDRLTLQLAPSDVVERLTPRTRAILPTHMNGCSAPLDDYLEIAEKYPHPKHGPLKVIGDAARACGGGYKSGKIGAGAWMTVFSWHTMKNMTTLGEGGCLTFDDPELGPKLRSLRQFGGDDMWGSNYKLTKVQAAVGLVQLARLDEMIAARRRVAHERNALLAEVPGLRLPYEPADCEHTYYLYTCMVPPEWAGEKRNALCQIMAQDYHVECVVANPPVHNTVPFLKRHVGDVDLPVSEEVAARLFCPSLHPTMTTEENEYVCAALMAAWERVAAL